MDLRPARHTRAQIEAAKLARRVELDLSGEGRTRPDDAHLPAQHVDQVGKLVEREAAEELADPRHPRVSGGHGRADADGVRSLAHSAELEELEDPPVLADPPLPVEHGAP